MKAVSVSKTEVRNVSDAGGFVLSKNIYSPLDLPPFDQSAMDGYAIIAKDVFAGNTISVFGESAAGKSYMKNISGGQAVRIFTGAEIPRGADTVVVQEKVSLQKSSLTIGDENLRPGLNIRTRGSQIKKGALALKKGTTLTPAAMGFIASMGLNKVYVFKKPNVSIIVTGNELQKPGTKLSRGKIFESNAITVETALRQTGVLVIKILFVGDDEKKIREALKKSLRHSDFVLFTGGISVGDYDFVGTALKKEKVQEVFYKVKQKPGKPLFFGMKNKKYVFGLPGNPASVLTCLYGYVVPAIKKFSGHSNCFLNVICLPLSTNLQKKKGLTHFLKATTDFKTVISLDGQGSDIMRSYAESNCLIRFPEETETMQEGEMADVILLS